MLIEFATPSVGIVDSQLMVIKPNKNNDTILWPPKGQTEKREE